ncbi:complement factor H-like [Pelobates fuscus]|uniref:complement factor H-like n=1 Tax=Pelobates fuscus TaxID=191477 RepID=UPI002FE48E04
MLLLGYFVLLAVGLNCNAAPVPCGPPPRDPEFELQGTFQESYPPGTTVTFTCRPGYSRQGFIKKTCADGNWEFIARGVCKRISCGHPGDIEFGTFDLKEGEGFVFGAVVEYSCDEGYQMVSKQRTRECTATGWSHYPPHCEEEKLLIFV